MPEGFFPEVRLTDEQVDEYEDRMEEIVKAALDEYAQHENKGPYPVYRPPWSLVGTVDMLTTIRKEDPVNPTPSRARIFGRINGDYRHFVDFFYAETSRQLFEWNKFMFGYVVDTHVLRNIHTQASGRPHLYMGIKWTCLQPSTLVQRRDNVYMEYLTYAKDSKGRDVGVRVTLPLEIPECPPMAPEFKTKRIRLYTVWISRAVPNEPFSTDFFMLSENDFNGLAVTGRYYKKMMRILRDMAVFVDSRRIVVQGMVTRNQWVPGESRKNCKLCSRRFHAARRRHHCRLCGEVICRRCIIVRDAPKGERSQTDKTFKVAKTKFCMLCVTKMREAESSVLLPGLTASQASSADVGESRNGKADHSQYSHSDWEYDSRNSTWSETESEDGKRSMYSNSDLNERRSSLSECSETSEDKMSFVATLEVIKDEPIDKGIVLRSEQAPAQASLEPTNEVTEIIDTTEMLPMSRASQRSASRMSNVSSSGGRPSAAFSDDHDFDFFGGQRASYAHSVRSTGSTPVSPRTLDQSLAEQEELLRRMLVASGRNYVRPTGVKTVPGAVNTTPSAAAPPATATTSTSTSSSISRPVRTKVKLYEM